MPAGPPIEAPPPGPPPPVANTDGSPSDTSSTALDHARRDQQLRPAGAVVKRPRRRATHDWAPLFIASFRNSGNVRAAAEAAGVDRSTPYLRAERDPAFAAAWAAAKDDAVDLLVEQAFNSALEGNTRLTIFLLQSMRPETYRPSVEVRFDVRPVAERIASKLGLSVDELIEAAGRLARELD